MKTPLVTRERDGLAIGGALPRVNLLPPEIRAARNFRKVQAGLVAAVMASVAVAGAGFVAARSSVGGAQAQLSAAQSETAALQRKTATYAGMTATYQRAAAARTLLTTAMGQEVLTSRMLSDLPSLLPEGVWLSGVTFTQAGSSTSVTSASSPGARTAASGAAVGTISFTGAASSHPQVAAWLDALAKEKGFGSPQLTNSTEVLLGGTKVVNWTVTVTLSSDVLSGRYTKTGS